MSARTDVVVYSQDGKSGSQLKRQMAVEFKAHNAPIESISKDLEKLAREGDDGLWFHPLRNIDSHTMSALFSKLGGAFQELLPMWRCCTRRLTFVFVVINKRLWLHRTISPDQNPASLFEFSCSIQRGNVVVRDANGWGHEIF